VLAADPPPASGVTAEALRELAADAAERAFEMAHGRESSGLELSPREDLARRASRLLDDGPAGLARMGVLAGRAAQSGREVKRWALAWQAGGPESLEVLLEAWEPPAGQVLAGKQLLLGLGTAGRSSIWRNRVSVGERQLRLGRDGRWYPYRRAGRTGWDPDGPPLEVV